MLCYDKENKFLHMIRNSKEYEFLGDIPSNSVFNTRLRKLTSDMVLIKFYNTILNAYTEYLNSDKRIIDSQPVIFKSSSRKNSINKRITGMDVGYCSSLNLYYFGYKLHLLITEKGFPTRFAFSKASEFDNNMLMDLTYSLSYIYLIGDKGYIDKDDKKKLKDLRNIQKVTPYRKNMKCALTKEELELLSLRRQIENDFSIFTNMNVKYCRAKTSLGVFTRVIFGIITLCLIITTNMNLYGKSSIAYCEHFR